MRGFTCPACGFDGLFEKPWDGDSASDEICPCCGIHFGYDDAAGDDPLRRAAIYAGWRQRWKAAGYPWFSAGRSAPAHWDPAAQLERALDHH